MEINNLLKKLTDKKDLSSNESEFLLDKIVSGDMSDDQIRSFLTDLKNKGESVEEILGLIRGLRKYMLKVTNKGPVVDIVGSGGDGQNSFNISTTAAFIVAGAGVKVAKHGNRAASSKCGSADVLQQLGVNLNLTPQRAAAIINKVGMVFLFAPLFHPAFKRIGPIRKELGFRTVFNFLGPFLNPAMVQYALIGLPSTEAARKLSEVALKLNYKHAIIFSSGEGMDEISTSSPTTLLEISNGVVSERVVTPEEFGINEIDKKEIEGGDAKENAQILRDILEGKKGPRRDVAVFNAAFALLVAGKVKNVKDGLKLSEESIDQGKAMKVLDNLIRETNE